MSSTLTSTHPALSGAYAVLADHVGNEVYAAHYSERRASRFIIGSLSVLLLGSGLLIHSLANRPIPNRYVRIDEMGRAQAIQYSDLSYSPREGEVRTYLTDWANYRFTVNRDTVTSKYPLSYYFLSQQLASQYMSEDNNTHFASQVLAGQIEQTEVEVKNVTITSMQEETIAGSSTAKGTALVNIDRLYSPRNSHEPRVEHWLLSVTYYLNPKQVNEEARVFPQFETINPLGLTITEFHENRASVDLIPPGGPAEFGTTGASALSTPGARR